MIEIKLSLNKNECHADTARDFVESVVKAVSDGCVNMKRCENCVLKDEETGECLFFRC